MRYYAIEITSADGSPNLPSSLGGQALTSILDDGSTNPAALQVEFDIPVAAGSVPSSGSFIRIWGLGLEDVGQSYQLAGSKIKLFGGMARGLPLADPSQAGLLTEGKVFQAFGNWIGTDQTVDLIIIANTDQPISDPANFSFNWLKGTQLSEAIKTTLETALNVLVPGLGIVTEISPNLVLQNDEAGSYGTFGEFAQYLNGISRSIINDPNYRGVDLISQGETVTAFDGTVTSSNPIQINIQDLIGQPTWIPSASATPGASVGVQFKTVMRADIHVKDFVTLPQGLQATTPESLPIVRNNLVFTGKYQVLGVHHYANYRQPDAASWCTVFDTVAPFVENK